MSNAMLCYVALHCDTSYISLLEDPTKQPTDSIKLHHRSIEVNSSGQARGGICKENIVPGPWYVKRCKKWSIISLHKKMSSLQWLQWDTIIRSICHNRLLIEI